MYNTKGMFIAAVLIAVAEGGVIRKEFPIPPEGISMDITFKTNSKVSTPISLMNVNVFKDTVTVNQNYKFQGHELPMTENRISTASEYELCPIGYFKLFRICVPINKYDFDPEYSEEAKDSEVEETKIFNNII